MQQPSTASKPRAIAASLGLALAAGGCWLAAVVAIAPLQAGGGGTWLPMAASGARDAPEAAAFNALAFVLPGLLAAALAWRARSAASRLAAWPTRLGWQCVLLSALAFAAQGLLPLDLADLDGTASRGHAVAWTLWWIAFVPGVLLLAAGSWSDASRRATTAALHVVAGLTMLLLAWRIQGLSGQWLATVLWLAWLPLAAVTGKGLARPA